MTESNRRQWIIVGAVVAALAGLVAVGWTARARFLPVEVGSQAPQRSRSFDAGAPGSRPCGRESLTHRGVSAHRAPRFAGPEGRARLRFIHSPSRARS
ncbi:MAG TPA: hypothetical protein VF006_33055, partial [Longimicrobium sp.]